jgi:DnaJ-class molecular chaperone with C-terminal Zn finger domain
MNPFDHLGIPPDSDQDAIRSAYRRLAKSTHPDANPGDASAAARFAALQDAYQAALELAAAPPVPEQRASSPRRPSRHRTVYREISLDVNQAITGARVAIEGASGLCQHCSGTGRLACSHPVGCATCDGSGIISVQSKGYISVRLECHECLGEGMTNSIPCHHCGGFGVSSTSACVADIPPNVRDGDTFRIEGAASIPEENVRGDIEFVVRIDDRRYSLSGDDIETTVVLDIWHAARGCSVPVRLPDGSTVKLTVPPGSAHGRRFAMKGRGMPPLHDESSPGDFVAVVELRPIKVTTPEIAAALAALEKAVMSARAAA